MGGMCSLFLLSVSTLTAAKALSVLSLKQEHMQAQQEHANLT